MTVGISVIIASHNRPDGIRRLVEDLADQQLSESFEVIIVDDASTVPVADALHGVRGPQHLQVLRLAHSGPAVARDHGTQHATGSVIVFVDDDMRLPPTFLAAHLAAHRSGEAPMVVLGTIEPAEAIAEMPLFERYHARQLERFRAAVRSGRIVPRGVHLCTGNVSLTAEAYRRCGGFDLTLRRSEDRDLGVRLQRIGARFHLCDDAISVHGSDHSSVEVWLRRATAYGRSDTQITLRHPDDPDANAWRFWSMMPRAARPLLAAVIVWPALGPLLARLAFTCARGADVIGWKSPAITLTALAFATEYFRGLRLECGSVQGVRRLATPRPATSPIAVTASAMGASVAVAPTGLIALIRSDHEATRRQRQKYHGEQISSARLGRDLVMKIGFQMLAWTRLMTWLHARRVPLLPAVCSRLIRHLYGAEIHWRARISPGVSIVHGTGLVISHGAEVGSGCILFHGVTLGESIDPVTGVIGAPTLGRDVHVGPGATILGPITIGDGSKVMAGCVVTSSVPAGSLVASAVPTVTPRARPATVAAARGGEARRRQQEPPTLPLSARRGGLH